MRIAPCALAVVVAGTTAGCAYDYYGNNYASAPPAYYRPGYSYTVAPAPQPYYYSTWDNGGSYPGQERFHND